MAAACRKTAILLFGKRLGLSIGSFSAVAGLSAIPSQKTPFTAVFAIVFSVAKSVVRYKIVPQGVFYSVPLLSLLLRDVHAIMYFKFS